MGAKRAFALLLVGMANLFGVALGSDAVSGLAFATAASPAPKVFTSVQGLETFSSTFELVWTEEGRRHRRTITYRDYPSIEGPYNRRNVFGAVLAYGPVLSSNEATRPMFESVADYGLCGDAPLLRELGLDPDVVSEVEVHVTPRPGSTPRTRDGADLPLVLEASCSQ